MMNVGANEGIEGKRIVVIGGMGFVGSSLCVELARRGASEVRSFDVRSASPFQHRLLESGVVCFHGDVSNKKDVEKGLRGAYCVFHLASYGKSGKEMIQYGRIDDVNINGTCNVLEACLKLGIQRLIYLSTPNVVFSGEEVSNGNEGLPYCPTDSLADPYSRTKSIAERLVLKYNARPLNGSVGKCLYTAAVRPGLVYGPGEERNLPRIISLAQSGLFLFKIGESSVKTDWVYVDNLVHSLLLVSVGLLDDLPGKEGDPIASGKPYFISDGSPVNTFDFLSPLITSLNYTMPRRSLSIPIALALGKVNALAYMLLYPWMNCWWLPQPMILPAEVYKVGVTHYFSYIRAKNELGYSPIVSPREGMAATISYWQEKKRRALDGPTEIGKLPSVVGMILLFIASCFPDMIPALTSFYVIFFRSMVVMRVVFVIAVALHVGEALYARNLARRVDPENVEGWFWQTLAMGIFSLRFLLKRARSRS